MMQRFGAHLCIGLILLASIGQAGVFAALPQAASPDADLQLVASQGGGPTPAVLTSRDRDAAQPTFRGGEPMLSAVPAALAHSMFWAPGHILPRPSHFGCVDSLLAQGCLLTI